VFGVKDVSMKLVAFTLLAITEYGPPLTVERLTLYEVANGVVFHVNVTLALPTNAASPVGAGGAFVGGE
jgi:hypothetical protein